MEPRHLIVAAITVSVAIHLALVSSVFLADAQPIAPPEIDHVAVDVVTPQQLAEAEKLAEQAPPPEPPRQQPKPDEFRLPDLTPNPTQAESKPQQKATAATPAPASPPSPPPQAIEAPRQQTAEPPPTPPSSPPLPSSSPQQQAALQPAPVTPPPDVAPVSAPVPPRPDADLTVKYGVSLGLPDGFAGAVAWEKPDISALDIEAFRRHLKSCSKLPATVAPGDDARVKLRASFTPQGRLMAEPVVIEVRRPAKAVLLMQAAKQALEACQPYAMLPANKYDEWKVLDLDFTPQDFAG